MIESRYPARIKESIWRLSDHTLLIDLHIFSEDTIPKRKLKASSVPDICIGTNPDYTPEHLKKSAISIFSEAGCRVMENDPFSGCIVPKVVYEATEECRFNCIMIQVNESICLDQEGDVIPEQASKIREILKKLILEYDRGEINHYGREE